MIERLKSNRPAAVSIVASLAVLLLASALSACQIDDLVSVDVPAGVATAIDVEPRIAVSATDDAWEDWTAWVDRESKRFANAIDDGQRTVGVLTSLTETGISIGQDAASTLPGGAILGSGLALLGGLFLRRPGDDRREREAAEESYNAGLDRGRKMSQDIAAGIQALAEGAD